MELLGPVPVATATEATMACLRGRPRCRLLASWGPTCDKQGDENRREGDVQRSVNDTKEYAYPPLGERDGEMIQEAKEIDGYKWRSKGVIIQTTDRGSGMWRCNGRCQKRQPSCERKREKWIDNEGGGRCNRRCQKSEGNIGRW